MFLSFRTYALRPQYILPLADAPDTRQPNVFRLFLAEYPLILGVVVLSIALMLANSLITGNDATRLFSAAKHPTLLPMLLTGFFLVLFIELLFRYVLWVSPGRLTGLVALVSFIWLSVAFGDIKAATNPYAIAWALPAWGLLIGLLNWILKRPAVFTRIETFWQRAFCWIFYGSALLYGSFFFRGISVMNEHGIWLPLLLGPALLIGLYLGYVRMRFGFWYAVLVQTLIMSVPIGLEISRIL